MRAEPAGPKDSHSYLVWKDCRMAAIAPSELARQRQWMGRGGEPVLGSYLLGENWCVSALRSRFGIDSAEGSSEFIVFPGLITEDF